METKQAGLLRSRSRESGCEQSALICGGGDPGSNAPEAAGSSEVGDAREEEDLWGAGQGWEGTPSPGRCAPEEDTHRVGAPHQTQLWGRPGPLPPRPLSTAPGQAARVLLCPFCWAGRRDKAVGSLTAAAGDVSRQPFLPTAGLLHNRPKNNLQGGQCREMNHLPPGTP